MAAHLVVAELEALGDGGVYEATTSHIDGYGAVRSDGCGKLCARQFIAPTAHQSVRGGYGGCDAYRHGRAAQRQLDALVLCH